MTIADTSRQQPYNRNNPKTYTLTLEVTIDGDTDALEAVRRIARLLPAQSWWQLRAWTDRYGCDPIPANTVINGGGRDNAQLFINEDR